MNPQKKKKKSDWDPKTHEILEHMRSSQNDVKNALSKYSQIRKSENSVYDYLQHKNRQLKTEIQLFENGVMINPSGITMGSLDYFNVLSRQDAEYSRSIDNRLGGLVTNWDKLNNSVTTSGATYANMLMSTGVYLAKSFENVEELQSLINDLSALSSQDRYQELRNKLKKIGSRYVEFLDGSWAPLRSPLNPERFSQASISMRNLLQRILGHLGPDEKVKAQEGYEPARVDKKGPSWTQRATYAICGDNKDIDEIDKLHIDNITKNAKKELDRLSNLAKGRGINEQDMQNLTEKVLDECQIYILNLLDAREKYFI